MESSYIKNFNTLKGKLMLILRNNPNLDKFTFEGVKHGDKFGLLVKGIDSVNVREFEKFYSIKDINYYFRKCAKNIKRIKR